MKTAFITGIDGFIGRNFEQYLEDDGYLVYGCDIKQGIDCREVFARERQSFDLVVHAAAIVGGRETIDGEPLKVATDLSIDADMFNWAVRTKQKRVLYFSSSAAYPIMLQTPNSGIRLREGLISLDNVRKPDQSYGWVKVTGEVLAGLTRDEGVPVTVVRPFSGYGTDQDMTYPFPSFIHRALAQRDPFPIWGDGEQTRDFIHVSDVVNGCMALIEDGTTLPVNLATGRPVNFKGLADLVTESAGYHPDYAFFRDKPMGVGYRVADTTRMSEFYVPSISLEEGISLALRGTR